MDKIEMPPEWEKVSETVWKRDFSEVGINHHSSRGWYASSVGDFHPSVAGGMTDALTLARALTPGWVVVEQSRIDTLESMLDAGAAREEDLQRELDDAKRLLQRANRDLGALKIELEQTRQHPILSRVRRLFGGAR